MFKNILLFSMMIFLSLTISIPLIQNYQRCMIVYTSTPQENLILDVRFPPIPNLQNGQHYRVTFLNTEDKSQAQKRVNAGTFREQLDLQENVVYKICFSIITNRSIGTIHIQYNAETKFHTSLQNVKVPESLLKSQDFKNTYSFAQNMHQLTQLSIQYQNDRRSRQDAIYKQNKSNIDTLFWISLFEITVILVTGIYQFFNVRNFLTTKNYI